MNIFSKFLPSRQRDDEIVIVSGLPRSGTSMMMKMLAAGGLDILSDGVREANEDNPGGFYEFERAKKLKEGDYAWLPEAQGKTVKVISALLPHLPENYNYKVIFMRRSLPEILASQRKMLLNRGEDPDEIPDDKMAPLFEKHLAETLAWLDKQPNVQYVQVDYNRLLQSPEPSFQQLRELLGERVDLEPMSGVIDPSLYRQRSGKDV
jgi:hypothetical protein